MKRERWTVALAGDSAGCDGGVTGSGVAMRAVLGRRVRLLALEPPCARRKLPADSGFDEVVAMPRADLDPDAYAARLRELNQCLGIDVILANAEPEVRVLQCLTSELRAMDIGTALPSRLSLERTVSGQLRPLSKELGVRSPETFAVADSISASRAIKRLGLPVVVRSNGRIVELAHSTRNAEHVVGRLLSEGVTHVALQEFIRGEYFEVALVRDVASAKKLSLTMHKSLVTRFGRLWAGTCTDEPEVRRFAERVTDALHWHGSCCVEVFRDWQGKLLLASLRPVLPTWSHACATAGPNLQLALAYLAMGRRLRGSVSNASRLYYVGEPLELAAELGKAPLVTTMRVHSPDATSPASWWSPRVSSNALAFVNLENTT